MQSTESTREMLNILDKKYGVLKPFLDHKTPFELLIAVILSAQTTDVMVNKVTPELFRAYPDEKSLKNAKQEDVEKLISRVNYFRTKSRNIINTAKLIHEEFQGIIPNTISELIKLSGVGRKVANVIVAEVHNIPEGCVVDTHIKRVSYRVGWTDSQKPEVIEKDLMQAFQQDHYISTPKHLILIGRNYCFPKKPDCPNCPLNQWCEKRIEVLPAKNLDKVKKKKEVTNLI